MSIKIDLRASAGRGITRTRSSLKGVKGKAAVRRIRFANWGRAFSLRATQMKTEDHATSDRQFAE